MDFIFLAHMLVLNISMNILQKESFMVGTDFRMVVEVPIVGLIGHNLPILMN